MSNGIAQRPAGDWVIVRVGAVGLLGGARAGHQVELDAAPLLVTVHVRGACACVMVISDSETRIVEIVYITNKPPIQITLTQRNHKIQ